MRLIFPRGGLAPLLASLLALYVSAVACAQNAAQSALQGTGSNPGPGATGATSPAQAGTTPAGIAAGTAAGSTVYQTGLASWYGDPFHGRQTASGEIFDKNGLTAAHRTLPFGTLVLVTNLDNGTSITVRVNDRGPFIAGRIIDLSERAGKQLGLDLTGVARVSLQLVETVPELPPRKRIQLGSYGVAANAEAARKKAAETGYEVVLEPAGAVTRVVVYTTPEQLSEVLRKLAAAGFTSPMVSDVKP